MYDNHQTRRWCLRAIGGAVGGAAMLGSASADEHLPEIEVELTGEAQDVATEASGLAVFRPDFEAGEIHYRLDVRNICNVTMAHVHQGGPDEDGPPVVWLYPEEGMEPEPVEGRFTGTLAEGTFTPDDFVGPWEGLSLEESHNQVAEVGAYVNVHTEEHPGGEIRGQIPYEELPEEPPDDDDGEDDMPPDDDDRDGPPEHEFTLRVVDPDDNPLTDGSVMILDDDAGIIRQGDLDEEGQVTFTLVDSEYHSEYTYLINVEGYELPDDVDTWFELTEDMSETVELRPEDDNDGGEPEAPLALGDLYIGSGIPLEEEYIELINVGDEPIDFTGWTIEDRLGGGVVNGGGEDPWQFPDGLVLEPDEVLTIYSGEGNTSIEDNVWYIGHDGNTPIWRQDANDAVIIKNAEETVVFEGEYGEDDVLDEGEATISVAHRIGFSRSGPSARFGLFRF